MQMSFSGSESITFTTSVYSVSTNTILNTETKTRDLTAYQVPLQT